MCRASAPAAFVRVRSVAWHFTSPHAVCVCACARLAFSESAYVGRGRNARNFGTALVRRRVFIHWILCARLVQCPSSLHSVHFEIISRKQAWHSPLASIHTRAAITWFHNTTILRSSTTASNAGRTTWCEPLPCQRSDRTKNLHLTLHLKDVDRKRVQRNIGRL